MTRLVLTVSALLCWSEGFVHAQTTIAGDWDVTIQAPQGPNRVRVTFKQEGEKISGSFRSQMGEVSFDGGSLVGQELKFTFQINAQGQPLDVVMIGQVKGASIDGRAQFGGLGEITWSAQPVGDGASAVSARTTSTSPSTVASADASKASGPAGTWDATLSAPQGEFPVTLNLSESAGKLSGTFNSQFGEAPLTGTLDGKTLKLSVAVETPQGALNLTMTGDIETEAIVNGKVEIPGLGQMQWAAKRSKQ